MRGKKSKLKITCDTLLMCSKEDEERIGEKPKSGNVLIQWKITCEDASRNCYEKAKILFEKAKCTGNFNRTTLQNNQNIKKIQDYMNDNVEKDCESETVVINI